MRDLASVPRIDGLKAEVKSRETELRQIMQGGFKPEIPAPGGAEE